MPSENNPFFSIIVPAYNVEQYISECVDSVLAQSYSDFELILVDDGSTDRTGEICNTYAKKYQKSRDEHDKNQPHTSIVAQNSKKVNIRVLHQPNSGLSAARNTGVKKASGEYLIFLDGDDYLELDALAKIKHGIDQGNMNCNSATLPVSLDLLRFQAQEVFPDGRIVKYPEAGFNATSGVIAFRELARYHYTENAWLYAYRRNFFVENHFQYAEGCIAEDFGLTPLIIAKAQRVRAISDICYNYRQREGSIMHDATSALRRASDIERQLQRIIPEIAQVPGASPILHFLVASFLTEAAALDYVDFSHLYHTAQQSGWLKYLHPGSLRAVPRSFLLRRWPKIFYRLYHKTMV